MDAAANAADDVGSGSNIFKPGSLRIDRHISKFPCKTRCPTPYLAVKYKGTSDPCAQCNVKKVLTAAASPEHELAVRSRICIVLDQNLDAQSRSNFSYKIDL